MKGLFRIKKLDGMMVKGFFPPFVMATFIALFVLIMQTLWLYIDDILGKGASLFIVVEFLFYLSMSLVPLALPIGVLLASVMLFGSLGEHYELSSMKSAGISLFRIMLPLIFLSGGISLFSYLSNEYIIPLSNLKFKSRLYDLRKSSPTLNLEEGVFNDDFEGYVIHIGKKGEDGKAIEDVLIYDHQNIDTKGKVNIIKAKSGEMYASDDNNFFIMKLRDGNMYQEMKKGQDEGKYPFMRSSFKTWTKIFDLRQFTMNRTDEDLFKSNQSMKNSSQLRNDIDSMRYRINTLEEETFIKLAMLQEVEPDIPLDKVDDEADSSSTQKELQILNERREEADRLRRRIEARTQETYGIDQVKAVGDDGVEHLYQLYPKDQQVSILTKAKSKLVFNRQKISSERSAVKNINEKLVKHIYELHVKYSFAVVCLIFLFIGAPMGAIVRKGGFGYPLLISIVFFILFILLTIFCKKLAESEALSPILAAWVPALTLVPIGSLLTFRAMNDSRIIDLSGLMNWFRKAKSTSHDE